MTRRSRAKLPLWWGQGPGNRLFLVAAHKTELGRWNVDIFLLLLLLLHPLMLFIALLGRARYAHRGGCTKTTSGSGTTKLGMKVR